MEETINDTPEVEETKPEAETTAPAIEPEKTISELLPEKEEKANLIPESVFLGEKKARKALEKEVERLKNQIEEGASSEVISSSIDSIAEEHDIDKGFLKKLSSTIKAEVTAEMEAKNEVETNSKKFEDSFNAGFELALERGPEFKSIANKEIVKQLSLLPQNHKKTISQIVEETYGNAIQGRRTIETTTPGGGKDPEPLDLDKAGKDIEYFKKVMEDPKLKEQYNKAMLSKGY